MITTEEIERLEAHATSLLELAREMRKQLQPKKKTTGLSPSQLAMLDSQREKTLNRRNLKTPIK